MKKVAIVILNWNGKKLLEKFLPSVISNSPEYAEIIVADNASTDDSVEFIQANYPQIKVIINKSNGGFAKGYNDCLKYVEAEYYILLNSDIEVTPNWIEPIVELMDSDKNIAACQPKILAYNSKKNFEYAGASGGYIDKYGYPFCRGRILTHLEKDVNQYDSTAEVFWATGASMFLRAELFKKFDGFDEDYFAHMEEIDLCWRLKNSGYKIMVEPQSVVFHIGGGTLNSDSPRKTYYNFRNSLYTLVKNCSSDGFWKRLTVRLMFDYAAILVLIISLRFNHVIAVIKAHIALFNNWNRVIHKRNLIKKDKEIINAKGLFMASIVMQFYFKKINEFSKLSKKMFLK